MVSSIKKEKILIIDFGSQVTKLIARRVRELGVFSDVITPRELYNLKDYRNIKGIVLSGGPSTVTKKKFQSVPKIIFEKKINSGIKIFLILYSLKFWFKKFKVSAFVRFFFIFYTENFFINFILFHTSFLILNYNKIILMIN